MIVTRARLLPLIALLAFTSAYVDLRMRSHPGRTYSEYIPGVLAATEEAPGRYRVLAPYLTAWTAQVTGSSMATAWYVTRLLWFVAAWFAFQVYLETWFVPGVAFGGTALAAALLPLTYTNSWAHPDHIPELALMTAACAAIVRRADAWAAVLLALAALNRETSALIVVFYALSRPLTQRHVSRTAALGGLWLAIYVALRIWRGLQHYEYWQLGRNIGFLGLLPPAYDPYYRLYGWFVLLLIVPLLIVAWPVLRARAVPREVGAAVATVPVLVAVGLLFSSIIETRIFTPVLPLMAPVVMFAMHRPIETE